MNRAAPITHYNASQCPQRNKLPACHLGGDWGRDFSRWRCTADRKRVTCRRCLKVLEPKHG